MFFPLLEETSGSGKLVSFELVPVVILGHVLVEADLAFAVVVEVALHLLLLPLALQEAVLLVDFGGTIFLVERGRVVGSARGEETTMLSFCVLQQQSPLVSVDPKWVVGYSSGKLDL
jgi:hypothetical protein